MKKCETCAASVPWKFDDLFECRIGACNSWGNWPKVEKDKFCLQWTAREIGTCGECRWKVQSFCSKTAKIYTQHRAAIEHGDCHIGNDTPGCGDWEPK